MNRTYLGRLLKNDPLHGYLQHDMQPQITGVSARSSCRVFRLHGSNDVYQYEDRTSGTRLIGKFFYSQGMKEPRSARVDRYPEYNAVDSRDHASVSAG